MNRPVFAFNCISFLRKGGREAGFTMTELLIVVSIIGIISAMAIPAFSSLYKGSCLKSVMYEITEMIKQGKQSALVNEKYYAIGFNTVDGRVSLLSGRGPDGKWNTSDDEVVRSFRLSDMGGGLSFGHGDYGPIDSAHAAAPDGIAVPPSSNNSFIFNPDLTGNAGTVYIRSASGAAMALLINSEDYSYKMYKWNGKMWERL